MSTTRIVVGVIVAILILAGCTAYVYPGWAKGSTAPAAQDSTAVQAAVAQTLQRPTLTFNEQVAAAVAATQAAARPAAPAQPAQPAQPVQPAAPNASKAQKVVFPASVGGAAYNVVYDPEQGGSSDHAALGWWYQPNLPAGPQRVAHDVPIILQVGTYRFTGPECSAWLNYDGAHGWEQGTLLVGRQNIERLNVPATVGGGAKPGEAWVAVKCTTSAASGFSFEKLP